MVINLKIPWRRIIHDLKFPMTVIIIYMIFISIYDHYSPLGDLHVPISLITVPGTVIALLLGFRTNSAYDRWWEARKVWGSIVNDSRTWVRQLFTFVAHKDIDSDIDRTIQTMAHRHIAWTYALTGHLRKLPVDRLLLQYLPDYKIDGAGQRSNIPNALLFEQGRDVKMLFENNHINAYQQARLDDTLTKLTDAMGKCERIKNTVFPSSYSLLVDLLIYLWIIFLPFGLVDIVGYILIPTTISLAFSFLVIDRIAVYMQDPFEDTASDTPMLALSRTIEINIREELREKNIPKSIRPQNGVLM